MIRTQQTQLPQSFDYNGRACAMIVSVFDLEPIKTLGHSSHGTIPAV
jgi:hypothetical protein